MLFYGTAVEYPLVFANSRQNGHITGTRQSGAEPKIVNAVCILPSVHRNGHDSLGLVSLVVYLAVAQLARKPPQPAFALRVRHDSDVGADIVGPLDAIRCLREYRYEKSEPTVKCRSYWQS
jgi:hypothetical protein